MKTLFKKKTWLVAGALAFVWIAFCVVDGIVSIEYALHPYRLSVTQEDQERAREIAMRNHAKLASVSIAAEDGTLLRGWAMRPREGNNDVVLLLHGMGYNRASMLGYADMLLQHGFSVLLPDARAQGSSGGTLATFGVMESADLKRWYDWIERWMQPNCVDGMGESMGAGQILDALKEIPEMCAVVAESPYATFRQAAYDRLGQEFGTGPWVGRTVMRPAVTAAFLYARLRYGVDLNKASPEKSVATSHVPVLLIHGREDRDLPPRHSEMMKAANHAVALWEPRDAGHTGASTAEPRAFERHVVGWFVAHHVEPEVPMTQEAQ
ncbi:MAG: alpha/beta fold hydrolase [Acidobacteriota bacterium]|nr:alpha/beta fold hydrolase [Acidobacteriota bacterium]